MLVGTVLGTVVAPIQHSFYVGQKLLLVRTESPVDGTPAPEGVLLAIDRAHAGVGDKVMILKEGSSARAIVGDARAPVRTVIVGVIDAIEIDGRTTYEPGMDDSDGGNA